MTLVVLYLLSVLESRTGMDVCAVIGDFLAEEWVSVDWVHVLFFREFFFFFTRYLRYFSLSSVLYYSV